MWDADGNCIIDWTMALTSISLGHAYPAVNRAVSVEIEKGVNFQRPSALELAAAEKFVEFSRTDMVKFAKHGSTVTTGAVKLARAYTGRTMVAVPAEQPFFSFDDWFIGTTDADLGIPKALKEFTKRFHYNDIESVHALFKEYPEDIACVILEPVKFDPPKDDFLHELKALCEKYGIVLIFDEMITGLKFGIPGACSYFGVQGDLYTYGKGIANGYSAAALTGRGDIMRLGGAEPVGARKLFLLSTTHGAESTGLAAMMATIDEFIDGKLIESNWKTGEELRSRLHRVFAAHGLEQNLVPFGYPCLMGLKVLGPNMKADQAFGAFLVQELAAAGVLFGGMFVLTPSHGRTELDETVEAFDRACGVYKAALEAGSVGDYLVGPATKPVFRRFN